MDNRSVKCCYLRFFNSKVQEKEFNASSIKSHNFVPLYLSFLFHIHTTTTFIKLAEL